MKNAATSADVATGHDPDGRLIWTFGEGELDVQTLCATSPSMIGNASAAYLWKDRDGATIPKAEVTAESACQHVGTLFPNIELMIAPLRPFDKVSRKRTKEEPSGYNALLSFDAGPQERWRLLMTSSDKGGRYVGTDDLLVMLGQYVLFSAGGVFRTDPPDTRRIPVVNTAREALKHYRDISVCDECLFTTAELATAYALAHFMNLDTRVITFRILKDCARKHETMGDLFSMLMIHQRQVVSFERPMAAYLKQRAGLTRDQWRAATVEERVGMTAEAGSALLQYWEPSQERARYKAAFHLLDETPRVLH